MEALILILGLLVILSFFFPSIYRQAKNLPGKTTSSPTASASSSSSSSSRPAAGPAPDCGQIIGLPSLTGQAPFRVTLVATGRQTQYPILGFRWDFNNDGQWDTVVVTDPQTYVFSSPGSHRVSVQILDEKQNSRVCSTVVTVR